MLLAIDSQTDSVYEGQEVVLRRYLGLLIKFNE